MELERNDSKETCEESWRLISKLRKDLAPDKLRNIVNRFGLPSSGSNDNSKKMFLTSSSQFGTPSVQTTKWLTMADIKVQAVKEVCYEVALNGFKQTRNEIEAACLFCLQKLCQQCGKRDPKPNETWRSVARDVMDTIGFFGDQHAVKMNATNSQQTQHVIDSEFLEQFERTEVVKEVVKNMVEAVVKQEEEDNMLPNTACDQPVENKSYQDVEELKRNMSNLVDMLQGVKLENESKQEEIREMKSKMEEMEKALSENADYGKSLLMREFVNSKLSESSSEKDYKSGHRVGSVSGSSKGRSEVSSQSTFSPNYIRSDDFSQPSPGVVVPEWIETKEDKIKWLMDNDVAFRRGRLRWEAQQKRHQANLKMQEVNKEKRRMSREGRNQDGVTPRFSFKSSYQAQQSKTESKPTPKKYFEGPRRKTCSSIRALNTEDNEDNNVTTNDQPLVEQNKALPDENVAEIGPTVPIFTKQNNDVKKSNVNTDISHTIPGNPPVQMRNRNGNKGNHGRGGRPAYYTQRRKTWCNFQNSSGPNMFNPFPNNYMRNLVPPPIRGPAIQQDIGNYCPIIPNQQWNGLTTYNQHWNATPQNQFGNILPQSIDRKGTTYYNQPPKLPAAFTNPQAFCESQVPFTNSYHVNYTQPYTQHIEKQSMVDRSNTAQPQFFIGNAYSPAKYIYDPLPPQIFHNPLNDSLPPAVPRTPQPTRANDSPPYMSTARSSTELQQLNKSKQSYEESNSLPTPQTPEPNKRRKPDFQKIYEPPFRRQILTKQPQMSWE
ncbi:uncharacterized protein LOC113474165 [Ciona intestinalis]